MSQERPSKPKRKTSATYTKPGTMASLENQKRSSYSQKYGVLTKQSKKDLLNIIEENLPQYPEVVAHVQTTSTTSAKYVVPAKQSNKERPNIIEENMLLSQYSGVAAHVQTRSTTPATQVIDEQVEEEVQLDSTTPTVDEQCEEQGPSIQPRKRGRKKMKHVHGRKERKVILLNNLNQPVGPSDKVVTEFGSFLGTLARNATLCPLDILDWRKMDTKEDIWEYTKAEMEEIEAQQSKNGNESVDAFASIMGPEHPGRLRLYGRGVTRTSLRGKVGFFESSSNTTNSLQKMEEKIQRMEEKIEEQKATIRQEVVADVLARLQRSGIDIDANIILAALGDNSPGGASSAQQPTLQPICRPSTDSNKEGQLIQGINIAYLK
ncbi:hypothetical protein A4A49_32356 [Nicotiana attenuata]|uniref:Uncharacterized protein n=1 Tax=Nicotiana attenuata TaxID=49451 RepID=A0A1J6IBT7_NICAT|nr:hypothetical protein A4A49_32356 [Nicotiana attenuata]